MNAPSTDPGVRGWILYDASCGLCRRWVPFWEGLLRRRGFLIAPLQEDWVKSKLAMDDVELLTDLRLLLADGTHLAGANAYRHALKCIWWAWPLYALSVLPGFRRVFDLSYRIFAQNRHQISNTCGLGS